MKRIMNGRLWDDDFLHSIACRAFDVVDPVTKETKQYREELLREYTLKPGHTREDTWVEGNYGRRITRDNCDLRRGQFLLKRHQGYSDGIFILLTEEEARLWFEKYCPDQVDQYREIFGEPENPWTGDGAVRLVEQAESRLSSMKWDKERAEERASKAEAELADLKAKADRVDALEAGLADLKAKADKADALETELADLKAKADRVDALEAGLADLKAKADRADALEMELAALKAKADRADALEMELAQLKGEPLPA